MRRVLLTVAALALVGCGADRTVPVTSALAWRLCNPTPGLVAVDQVSGRTITCHSLSTGSQWSIIVTPDGRPVPLS